VHYEVAAFKAYIRYSTPRCSMLSLPLTRVVRSTKAASVGGFRGSEKFALDYFF
jgi:hypothetical protein